MADSMNDQKRDNLLNLSLEATRREREKSMNLNVGYQEDTGLWDVIVKYSGDESGLAGPGITAVPLLGGYAIVTLPREALDEYTNRSQIIFVEKPKRLYFEILQAKGASCILAIQREQNLSGRDIIVGMVDSGVDWRHSAFWNPDGSSRILRLWDQSIPGNPPEGYALGTEYTKEELDEALKLPLPESSRMIPSVDFSGHGTAVLGIAAGSGSNGGIAYESDLMVVKMGNARPGSFPRTTELMMGVDYLVRQAIRLNRPLALNLSFGNNYGSHEPYN